MAKETKKNLAAEGNGERKYRAPALEKGLDILELLAREGASMTTSQMAARLGRSVSELFRMVLVLEQRGYIAEAEDRDGYGLTNKLFALGMAQTASRSLTEAALPVMNELSRTIGQSCHLVVPSGDQIVVIARVESPRNIGFAVRVGYRLRLIDSASGLVLFGNQTKAEQAVWLSRLTDPDEQERIEAFVRQADGATQQGYVRRPSKFVDGVTDLSVPIIGAHGAIAALVVPFIISKLLPASVDEALEELQLASRRISEMLPGES